MTMDRDEFRRQDAGDEGGGLYLAVLLLALVVGLLVTGAAVYVACEHPVLAQPLGVGASVMSALAGVAGAVMRVARR
ncbi:hypothetical protein [Streptomyces sp. 4F14]|uniref:hypothetical protein n=1 Tax=Streptomyces sp. 4F14 TaxID=3394380 RepID=UPI003A85201E